MQRKQLFHGGIGGNMGNKFRDIFYPELKLIDKKITSMCPCDTCEVYKEYEMKALYENIAERQYATLPDSCRICIPKLNWEIDCMTKLRWYEENDERFKKKG